MNKYFRVTLDNGDIADVRAIDKADATSVVSEYVGGDATVVKVEQYLDTKPAKVLLYKCA